MISEMAYWMIWKYQEQSVLFPKGLNWVQHLVRRLGLFSFPRNTFHIGFGNCVLHMREKNAEYMG